MYFGKQKIDVTNQLKMSKFIFEVKLLKMNRFIKSIQKSIIKTLNPTLEVLSLHPWDATFCNRGNLKFSISLRNSFELICNSRIQLKVIYCI